MPVGLAEGYRGCRGPWHETNCSPIDTLYTTFMVCIYKSTMISVGSTCVLASWLKLALPKCCVHTRKCQQNADVCFAIPLLYGGLTRSPVKALILQSKQSEDELYPLCRLRLSHFTGRYRQNGAPLNRLLPMGQFEVA